MTRVAVVGDVLLDVYRTLTRTEWDDAINGWAYDALSEASCPGGAANVAMNVRALGCAADLVSVVGRDAPGRMALSLLRRGGVGIAGVDTAAGYETPLLSRLLGLDGAGDVRIDDPGGWAGSAQRLSPDATRAALARCQAVVVSDYGRIVDGDTAESIVAMCRREALPLVVDPRGSSPERYRGATCLKVNAGEAATITGQPELAAEELARQICDGYDLQCAVITCGSEGAVAVAADGGSCRASQDATCRNAAGGGDAVAAALAIGLAEGLRLEAALAKAMNAAARSVESACTCPTATCVGANAGGPVGRQT